MEYGLQHEVEPWTVERAYRREVWHEDQAAVELQRDVPVFSMLRDRPGPD
jgi:hypothetical protein